MKKLAFISLLALLQLALVPSASAETSINTTCPGNGFSGLCLSASQLGPVVGSFITFAFVIIGLVALGFLVYGGFKWLTSQGEKQAVEEAQHHIVAAIIGLIIVFLSYLVVNVLLGFLTGGKVNLGNLSIPTLGQP